jgi:hypothetical protein
MKATGNPVVDETLPTMGDMEIRSNSPGSWDATRHAHTKRNIYKSRQSADPNGIKG